MMQARSGRGVSAAMVRIVMLYLLMGMGSALIGAAIALSTG
jgi:hypothetical protein